MLQAGACFSAGMAIREKMQGVALPTLRRASPSEQSYKLTVRVLAASAPGLEAPGLASGIRPYLSLSLGSTEKETQFADFAGFESTAEVGKCGQDCPWRFSDSITFRASLQDLMGPGLKLKLFTRKDVTLWPMQFQMQPVQGATGLVDLKTRVLPALDRRGSGPEVDIGTRAFMSPLVLVAMSHIKGGVLGASAELGQAVAHVAMMFSMDVDPEDVFYAAGFRPGTQVQDAVSAVKGGVQRAGKTLNDVAETAVDSGRRTANAVDYAVTRLGKAVESFDKLAEDNLSEWLDQPSKIEELLQSSCVEKARPINVEAAKRRAEMRQWAIDLNTQNTINDPDFDHAGWVSHRGPNGRVFWHHLAMGPPPWEAGGGTPPATASARAAFVSPGTTMSPSTVKSGALNSPDESPEGWLSFTRKDGRVLWHHQDAGPAPWTTPEGKALLEKGASP